MSDYHESWDALPGQIRDLHRALKSLIEEIEAVDWYHQRIALCEDDELRSVLAHNRDEEMEHACMTLEWLRRKMPGWDAQLRKYLFSSGSLVRDDEGHERQSPGSLKIGSLKGR